MFYSYRELIYRVGSFFIMVGFFLILLFIVSDSAGKVIFDYFCWGTFLLVVGFLFRAQYKKSVEPSGRFGIFKRLSSKKPKDKG